MSVYFTISIIMIILYTYRKILILTGYIIIKIQVQDSSLIEKDMFYIGNKFNFSML